MNRFIINKNRITKTANWIYIIILLFFFLDAARLLEIKSQFLKSFIYNGFMISSFSISLWNVFAVKSLRNKIITLVLPACAIAFIIAVTPLKIEFSSGAWRTQTVLYENGQLSFKTIEYQMQDIGAAGYSKRTVEVLYLTKVFMITHPVPENIQADVPWIKVDKDVDELRLK